MRALGLRSGSKMSIEVQFQMDRLHFCQMHWAVDRLPETDSVFPDIRRLHSRAYETHTLKLTYTKPENSLDIAHSFLLNFGPLLALQS